MIRADDEMKANARTKPRVRHEHKLEPWSLNHRITFTSLTYRSNFNPVVRLSPSAGLTLVNRVISVLDTYIKFLRLCVTMFTLLTYSTNENTVRMMTSCQYFIINLHSSTSLHFHVAIRVIWYTIWHLARFLNVDQIFCITAAENLKESLLISAYWYKNIEQKFVKSKCINTF